MEWQPIETAPKNGKSVMAYVPRSITHKVIICYYKSWKVSYNEAGQIGVWLDRTGKVVHNPTHWMPLPNLPSESKENKEAK